MRGRKAKMMRRIVARDFGNDFRTRDYEPTPQTAALPRPQFRLVGGSARHIYRAAKRNLRRRHLARILGAFTPRGCYFCKRGGEHCALGGYYS